MQSGVSALRPNETPLRPPHVHTHTYLLKSHFRKNTPNLWKLGSESKSQVRYLQITASVSFCFPILSLLLFLSEFLPVPSLDCRCKHSTKVDR